MAWGQRLSAAGQISEQAESVKAKKEPGLNLKQNVGSVLWTGILCHRRRLQTKGQPSWWRWSRGTAASGRQTAGAWVPGAGHAGQAGFPRSMVTADRIDTGGKTNLRQPGEARLGEALGPTGNLQLADWGQEAVPARGQAGLLGNWTEQDVALPREGCEE